MSNKSVVTKETKIGGRTLKLEVGRYAEQASSAVYVQYGETAVLVTVVVGQPKEDAGYLPLSVDYIERLYAGGRIKGSRWVKREGRPSDEGILIGRLIDRSIRPLFPKNFYNEVQVAITVLSVDMENNPDVPAIIGASAALSISPIPWNGPIGAVRVGLTGDQFILNPVTAEIEKTLLDMVVSANKDRIVMIEGGANQVSEDRVLEGLFFAQDETKKVVGLIEELVKAAGQTKMAVGDKKLNEEVKKEAEKFVKKEIDRIFKNKGGTVQGEGNGTVQLKEAFLANILPEQKKEAASAFEFYWKRLFREKMLGGIRSDGRKVDEVRSIEIEVGVLPRTHGSALFKRGSTQVLSVTTLGTPSLQQLIESATGEEVKRYMHHYSMPPYATGETGRIGSPNRREIGHGALAERALLPVIPVEEQFPYTIRIVSEVMSSNGSSSMASTCGSTLSLMDAGVPILNPIAGVAMGLVTGDADGGKGDYLVLTDIAGVEDFNGDMDFKITGSDKGITAIQLDVKIPGLTREIIIHTFKQSLKARLFILEKMATVLSQPRKEISKYAPKIQVLHIAPDKIGEVIGPGGKMIRRLIEETGCQIDIEDDGSVNISGPDDQSVANASARINGMTQDVIVGQVYEGEVKRMESYGAFIEVLPGKEGLLHVSQMSTGFVSDPSQVVSMGQKVQVKVNGVDERGRIDLTMLLNGEKKDEAPRSEQRPERRQFGGGGFRRDNRSGGYNQDRGGGYPSRYMPKSRYGR